MRKLAAFMALMMITMACLSTAFAEEHNTAEAASGNSGDYEYAYLEDGTICITAYTGSSKKVTIPEQIGGVAVTQIGEMAFAEYEVAHITAVTLPDTIRAIGKSAFGGCSRLTKINLPSGLIEIGDLAFIDCRKLTKLTLPASLSRVGANPFVGCPILTLKLSSSNHALLLENGALYTAEGVLVSYTGKKSSLDIWQGTTVIGAYAFSANDKLKKVTIPSTVTEICENAFNSCDELRSIVFPESLVSIGEHAFLGCARLKSVSLPLSLTNLSGNPFACCDSLVAFAVPEAHPTFYSVEGILCERETETLISFPAAKGEHFTVPDGIRIIGKEAFYNCRELYSLRLPDTVTTLEDSALRGCIRLTDLRLPDSIAYLGKWALSDCGFTEIHIPASLTEISDLCFDSCNHLMRIDIPQNITRIGNSAFQGCFQLAEITIPENVTEIGQNAFNGCMALGSVTLPSRITSIHPYTFIYCSALKEIHIPDSVTEIGEWAFEGTNGLEKAYIPDTVQTIGDRAFGVMNDRLTIITPSGSYAEDYATENGICVENENK